MLVSSALARSLWNAGTIEKGKQDCRPAYPYQNSNSGAFASSFRGFLGETDPLLTGTTAAEAGEDPAALEDVGDEGEEALAEATVEVPSDAARESEIRTAPAPEEGGPADAASFPAADLFAALPLPP
jgi:hypothetical protein